MPDVSPLYEGRQSEDFQGRDTGIATHVKALAFRLMARRVLRRIAVDPRLVVDYACGNGVLTAAFANELPHSTVVGLDFFETGPTGMEPARYSPFSQSSAIEGKADLLLCFHALEHDDDPHAFVRRLTSFVRPGGVMVIEVPNVDCVWTPWFGKACNNWYLPYHRLHFSRASLRSLMDANGLTVLSEEDVCSATIAMSLSRWLGVNYNALFFLAGCAFRPFQLLAEKITRRPSALRIVVRRD
jgi:SAM-dependent methyltransferase